MGGIGWALAGLLLLGTACFLFLWLQLRRRVARLAARAEAFLSSEEPPLPFSPEEGGLARLQNALSETQTRLRQSQARQKAENARASRLMTDISHQLKTPLSSLRLFCEMDAGLHVREEIVQVERMEGLIYSLLRLEKLCADGYVFSFGQKALRPLLLEAWEPLAALYPKKRFSLTGEAQAWCDAGWLAEALGNLLKNACEHTAPAGHIWARLEMREKEAAVSVEDDGGGVSAEELPRLFQRFYQAPGRESKGTGVGLNIVQEVVRRHHGDVRAENTGRGLRFTVHLPTLPQSLSRAK